MRVLIIGAGSGGAAAVAELSQAGHELVLWSRSAETLAPFEEIGGVAYDGVFGTGVAPVAKFATDLHEAHLGVDVAVVMLPTFAHGAVARSVADIGWSPNIPIILNPGHTGGALEFQHSHSVINSALLPIAQFSTLTYVARKYRPDTVTITGAAKRVRVAALPGGEAAQDAAITLFGSADPAPDVLFTDLSNVNLVLHPPGAILAAAWIEATNNNFKFYVDAMTAGVERVMQSLDIERRMVGRAFGHELPSLVSEMQRVGTVEEGPLREGDFAAAIASGRANSQIMAPTSLKHRFYQEDFGHGLVPFLALADLAGVEVPVARSLLSIGEALTGSNYLVNGRTARRMGISGLTVQSLLLRVRLQ